MDQTTDQIKLEIEEARERISEKTSQIGEKIRSTFDWRQQVADHPWAAVGMATAAGFFVGTMVAKALGGRRAYAEGYGESYTSPEARRQEGGESLKARAGGLTAALAGTVGPQLQEIGSTLGEQLKDLSNHLIAQGKEYMKERIDEWRGGMRRTGEAGSERSAQAGGSMGWQAPGS